MRPKIVFEGTGIEYELGRIVEVTVPKEFIYFERMDSGCWRMTYTKSVVPDIKELKGITIKREP